MRAIPVFFILLLAGCGGRPLPLPANSADLLKAVESSQDAMEVRGQLSKMGYTRIIAGTGPAPDFRWSPRNSDRLIMFWRIYTRAPKIRPDGTREYALKRSAKGAPRALELDEPPLLAALAEPGDSLARRGKWRSAGLAWEKARRTVPTLPLLHARLGDCHTALGDFPQAFASYSRAISMGGPCPEVFTRMGEMYEKFRMPRDAEDSFEKSAGLDPDNPARWVRLARSQMSHGKTAPARKTVERALKISPADPGALELEKALEEKR